MNQQKSEVNYKTEVACMYVGYSDIPSEDTYCLLNLESKKILLSQDVPWLNKNYG